jgi:hypothetical protein
MLSPGYRTLLIEMHQSTLWGDRGNRYLGDILPFFDGGSVLDYGAGHGSLQKEFLKVHPGADMRSYDPAMPGIDARPAPADLVVSTDVLEHIEPEHLDAVLAHIFSLARRRVYLRWGLTPAKRSLPDGRNAHLIVQPAKWWFQRIKPHSLGWITCRRDIGRKSAAGWWARDDQ